MPGPGDTINLKTLFPNRGGKSGTISINTPLPPLVTIEMSWGVLDLETNVTTQFDADGGHFQSLDGHRYLVFIRVAATKGVQRITLDGSGRFGCATVPDGKGESFQAPNSLPASVQHQEFVASGAPPTLQDLVVVMNPDIGAFDYFELSGGFHQFNTPNSLEYFAFEGLMTFSATAANAGGDQGVASLTTSP